MPIILIADDRPKLLEDLIIDVSVLNAEIYKAESESEALKAVNENTFDLVITDLRMNDKDSGLTILRAAKNKNSYTQIIIVTAFGTKLKCVEAMREGAFDYIERNLPGTDFHEMIRMKCKLAINYKKYLLESIHK